MVELVVVCSLLVILAAVVPSRPGYAWKPLFDYRMSEDTFRLYAAVVGLGRLRSVGAVPDVIAALAHPDFSAIRVVQAAHGIEQ